MTDSVFPYTDEELHEAGLFGEGLSEIATQVIETMRKYPSLLRLSMFALECINLNGGRNLASPTFSDESRSSTSRSSESRANSVTSEGTTASEHGPDEFESLAYYHGIVGNDDHPKLLYRSNQRTAPYARPSGRFANLAVKTLRGVHGTALNPVWEAVGADICQLLLDRKIDWSSINPARFFTAGTLGEDDAGSLGPVVVWIAVRPGSTPCETAHDVSQHILELLRKHGAPDVVVEWREAVLHRLAGPPLLRHANTGNATHHARRFLTPLLGVPLATEERAREDSQGTLTLWFHENRDKRGDPSSKVFGVSNRHVLRAKYGGAAKSHVRVCSVRRFQRGLDEMTAAIADHGVRAEAYTREIGDLKAKGDQDEETLDDLESLQAKLTMEQKAARDLEKLHATATKDWSDVNLHRNIGHVIYAPPITVDDPECFTSDWAVFEAAEGKIRPAFEGNVVDLGSKYGPSELTRMFYAVRGGTTTFKFPSDRKLRIESCSTALDLTAPVDIDDENQPCIIVGKDGTTTDLTVGRYAGLMSFVRHDGVVSKELAVFNTNKHAEPFSAKGDSGALVWHVVGGKARIFGQLHSGENKGAFTNKHVTYCTPGWHLLANIKRKFPHADFYRRTWA